MKRILRALVSLFLIFIVLAGVFSIWGEDEKKKAQAVAFSDVVKAINEGRVEKIEVLENNLKITLKGGEEQVSRKEPESSLTESHKNAGLADDKIQAINIDIVQRSGAAMLLQNLLWPILIPFL